MYILFEKKFSITLVGRKAKKKEIKKDFFVSWICLNLIINLIFLLCFNCRYILQMQRIYGYTTETVPRETIIEQFPFIFEMSKTFFPLLYTIYLFFSR